MSIKSQLVKLYPNRNLPMEEYIQLQAFSILEKENNIIEKLEVFHLPEIIKLICGSETLKMNAWASKYKKISHLYFYPDRINVDELIMECKTVDVFEREILYFADLAIFKSIKKHYEDLLSLKEIKSKERKTLGAKINAMKKKIEESKTSSNQDEAETNYDATPKEMLSTDRTNAQVLEEQLSIDEKTLDKLKSELKELNQYLKKHKVYIEKIQSYERKVLYADSDENREKAYNSLNDMQMSHEEEFLKNFITSGVVSKEHQTQFRDQNFLNRVLQCLDKGSFKDYSLPILLKLYDEGAIDLIEGPASDFLEHHHERLCDYLVEKSPQSVADLYNLEIEFLVEKAIKIELRNTKEKNSSLFSEFWNTITDKSIWSLIISKVSENIPDENINIAVSYILTKLRGKAAKSLVEVLFENSDSKSKISTTEVIFSLLKINDNPESDVIIETIRLLEQKNRKIQRKLNTAERKLRSHSQELFSSVYLPMEQLEELAINLKLTHGEIKSSLVGAHLIEIILSLREGFESLYLHPVVDTNDWKYQNKIEFDPSVHRVAIDTSSELNLVRLRSLGFRYQDDEGEWKQYNAQASIENKLSDPKKEPHKRYTEKEQTINNNSTIRTVKNQPSSTKKQMSYHSKNQKKNKE